METDDGRAATGTAGTTGVVAGWYPDPTHRFELRYHNGVAWTADVATDGIRFVDSLGIGTTGTGRHSHDQPMLGGPPAHGGQPSGSAGALASTGGRNGFATASMVLGIVALGIGWLPFVVLLGAIAAVLAIVFGVVGRRRARTTGTGSGFALAGLITGGFGLAACVGGVVFTLAFLDAFEKYEEPVAHEAVISACTHDGQSHTAEISVTNLDEQAADFTVRVAFVREGTDNVQRRTVVLFDDVAPGDTVSESVTRTTEMLDIDCVISDVQGPLPFDVDPGV